MPRKRQKPAPASLSVRTQLLMGAAQAFGQYGYADTTVENVLQAAGVSRRTFYRFFRNKDELFDELAEAAAMLFLETIKHAANTGGTGEERLAACVDVYLRAPQTAGPIFRVLQAQALIPGSPHAARRQVIINALVDLMTSAIRDEQGREIDPLVVRGLVGAMETISSHVHATAPGDEALIERAKAAMLDIARRSLAA